MANITIPWVADASRGFVFYDTCRLSRRMEDTMRVLLADNQAKVRFALRALLAQQPGIEVVGEASSADDLMALLMTTRPNLALLDWELPGLAESGGLPVLRKLCPCLAVTVLSSRPGARRAAQVAGADAFVSKGDPPERLLGVLRDCRLERVAGR
jgi:two-component system response regulator DesR